jgi:hypothetical protein
MFFSGLPTCCGALLLRGKEELQEPRWKGDWAIDKPMLTGRTVCPRCGSSWLYSLNPRKVTMPKRHTEKRRARRRPCQRKETQLTQLTFDQQFTPDPNLTRPRHSLRETQRLESQFTPDQPSKEE